MTHTRLRERRRTEKPCSVHKSAEALLTETGSLGLGTTPSARMTNTRTRNHTRLPLRSQFKGMHGQRICVGRCISQVNLLSRRHQKGTARAGTPRAPPQTGDNKRPSLHACIRTTGWPVVPVSSCTCPSELSRMGQWSRLRHCRAERPLKAAVIADAGSYNRLGSIPLPRRVLVIQLLCANLG